MEGKAPSKEAGHKYSWHENMRGTVDPQRKSRGPCGQNPQTPRRKGGRAGQGRARQRVAATVTGRCEAVSNKCCRGSACSGTRSPCVVADAVVPRTWARASLDPTPSGSWKSMVRQGPTAGDLNPAVDHAGAPG